MEVCPVCMSIDVVHHYDGGWKCMGCGRHFINDEDTIGNLGDYDFNPTDNWPDSDEVSEDD